LVLILFFGITSLCQIEEESNGMFLLTFFAMFADQLPVDTEFIATRTQQQLQQNCSVPNYD